MQKDIQTMLTWREHEPLIDEYKEARSEFGKIESKIGSAWDHIMN